MLVGDNPFHGISHLSNDRARSRSIEIFNADYAIAISGVAGPNGGTKEKPVGTVAIGILSLLGDKSINIYNFDGDRKEVQIQATKTAFKIVFDILNKNS